MHNPFPRRPQRRPTNLPVLLIVDPEGARIHSPAASFDFSHYGIGVRSSASLVPGQIVDIIPSEGPAHAVRSRVVWANPQASGEGCQAGLEFLNPLLEGTPGQDTRGPSPPRP